jgi:hypothetical protein
MYAHTHTRMQVVILSLLDLLIAAKNWVSYCLSFSFSFSTYLLTKPLKSQIQIV